MRRIASVLLALMLLLLGAGIDKKAEASPSRAHPVNPLTEEQKKAIRRAIAQGSTSAGSSGSALAPLTARPGSDGGMRIALTFDDGPGPYTQRLLRILRENGAKASFCVIGNRVAEYTDTITMAIGQGSEIISHTYSHKNLTKIDDEELLYEMQMANSIIERAAGIKPRYLRPPYGSVNDHVLAVAQENGLRVVKWSIDPRDWKHRDPDKTYEAIMRDAKDGGIVVCHDIYQETVDAMERVIPDLVAMGYELVTVSELYEMN